MIKTELYKLFHSKNMYYIYALTIIGAFYLGIGIVKMNLINNNTELLSTLFFETQSVLITYFITSSALMISRDYNSNIFRILIGTGISKQNIIFSKFLIFILFGLFITNANALIAIFVIYNKQNIIINLELITKIIFIMLPFMSTLSIIFLISIFSKDIMKSIILNTIFSIIFVISVDKIPFPILHPLNMTSAIIYEKKEFFPSIIFISIIYLSICYLASYFIFNNQEL